jgi:hypothetical protein
MSSESKNLIWMITWNKIIILCYMSKLYGEHLNMTPFLIIGFLILIHYNLNSFLKTNWKYHL